MELIDIVIAGVAIAGAVLVLAVVFARVLERAQDWAFEVEDTNLWQ